MSLSFKKFLCLIGAIVLSQALVALIVWLYLKLGVASFGGELALAIPLSLAALILFYISLKKICKIG